jgi:3'(2'), 5'-bisphosphate nucleotidase
MTLDHLESRDLRKLEVIAREAGAAILGHYGAEIVVETKTDESPVTVADRAAHDVIVAALKRWTPDIPIISEEGGVPEYDARRGWRRFWLVDPLDGTKEFISRNGEFTVNVALIQEGDPVLAVVLAPAVERCYVAGRGLGAWRTTPNGPPTRLRSTPPTPGAALTVVESRSHPSAALEAFLQRVPVRQRIAIGSSLKFCLVAEGAADIYPRFGRTMEWDVAAGDCVFRQSGAAGERRSPLHYNKPDLANRDFILGWPEDATLTG